MNEQPTLIEVDPEWREEWKQMPEYQQGKQKPYAQLIVRFETKEDLDNFAQLIRQKLTQRTKSIWFPFKSHWGAGSTYYWTRETP